MIGLIDDVVSDWRAVVVSIENRQPAETTSRLRTAAQASSETLGELVQGMTWTETASPITALVKLVQQDSAWSYSFTYTDPRSGSVETVAGPSFAAKREAGLRAASAVWETAAKHHAGRAAGADVI
jgi:hypothetical protein